MVFEASVSDLFLLQEDVPPMTGQEKSLSQGSGARSGDNGKFL